MGIHGRPQCGSGLARGVSICAYAQFVSGQRRGEMGSAVPWTFICLRNSVLDEWCAWTVVLRHLRAVIARRRRRQRFLLGKEYTGTEKTVNGLTLEQ